MILNVRREIVGPTLLAASFLALAVPAAAQNSELRGVVNAKMVVTSAPCTVTGSTTSLGTFYAGATTATVAQRVGSVDADGQIVTGSASPITLGQVTCPNGVIWTATVRGKATGGFDQNFIDLVGATPATRMTFVPVTVGIDGEGSAPMVLSAGSGREGLTRTANGQPQSVNGNYALYRPLADVVGLSEGRYIQDAAALLVVDFVPIVPEYGT